MLRHYSCHHHSAAYTRRSIRVRSGFFAVHCAKAAEALSTHPRTTHHAAATRRLPQPRAVPPRPPGASRAAASSDPTNRVAAGCAPAVQWEGEGGGERRCMPQLAVKPRWCAAACVAFVGCRVVASFRRCVPPCARASPRSSSPTTAPAPQSHLHRGVPTCARSHLRPVPTKAHSHLGPFPVVPVPT